MHPIHNPTHTHQIKNQINQLKNIVFRPISSNSWLDGPGPLGGVLDRKRDENDVITIDDDERHSRKRRAFVL